MSLAAEAAPSFPPLLRGREARDPFGAAVAAGVAGKDPGLLTWLADAELLRLAVLFAPEIPRDQALQMTFAAGVALGDALGALAPPEVAVHHVWPDGVKLNGALCGALRAAAADGPLPEWLVVGLALSIRLPDGTDPGARPDVTALAEEGCGHIPAIQLLESWSRHLLSWVHRWEEDGPRPLFDAWLARAEGRGGEVDVAGARGVFLGLSETGGMLVGTAAAVRELPLSAMLDAPRRWPPA